MEKILALCATVKQLLENQEKERKLLKKLIRAALAKHLTETKGSLGTIHEWENAVQDMLVAAGFEKESRWDRLVRIQRERTRRSDND